MTRHPGHIREHVADLAERGRTRVLVIGGGINGIAAFRDLALQGVDVVLVERADFASGASAASSHMIHGGIRYLENGEFRLVRESVRERNSLLRAAPHFVTPLMTTIPIYSTFSGILSAPLRFLTHRERGRPTERGAALIKLGLMIYDTFSRDGGAVSRHRFHGRRRSHRDLPDLDPAVRYTATYFDASVSDPERLALDVLLEGERHGGLALNYVEAVGLERGAVRLRDVESGTEFSVATDVVVNASGPWTDLTNRSLGRPTNYLGGTKGSHIVLDHPELLAATRGREIFFEHSDGRIVLVYPLKGRVLVGTTDIEADPREPARCTDHEVDYFLDLIAHVFPGIEVRREQIVYRYSGIRPLPRHDDMQPGFVSRDYRIETERMEGTTFMSLVGGKWTTFRAIGETLADAVLAELREPRRVSTWRRAIGGGTDYPGVEERAEWIATHLVALAPERRQLVFARYGTRSAEFAVRVASEGETPLAGGVVSDRELCWLVEREHVVHLDDLVLRRTDLAFTGELDADRLKELAVGLASASGWSDARRDEELARCVAILASEHGVELSAEMDAASPK
jgi:glycerol-3-phosphate dehydrogenase